MHPNAEPHLPDWSSLPEDLREEVQRCNSETQWFWKGLEASEGLEHVLVTIRHALACSPAPHQPCQEQGEEA
jgi:hypothetical protein